MAEYGILASKSGVDVKTAADKDLAIDSRKYTLKQIEVAGLPTTITIPVAQQWERLTFTHNLGYKPAYDIYLESRYGKFFHLPGSVDRGLNSVGAIIEEATSSFIRVYVEVWPPIAGNLTLKILPLFSVEEDIA